MTEKHWYKMGANTGDYWLMCNDIIVKYVQDCNKMRREVSKKEFKQYLSVKVISVQEQLVKLAQSEEMTEYLKEMGE